MLITFFINNLDVVFFFYGLAFFVMGVSIFMNLPRDSSFKVSKILWLLGLFGIFHGINAWLDIFTVTRDYKSQSWDLIRIVFSSISFIFLFEFGRRLMKLTFKKFPNKWITFALIAFMGLCMFLSKHDVSILSRYILGFPGAFISALGFFSYCKGKSEELKELKVFNYFLFTAFAMAFYSVLAGIIVSKANFFPAFYINDESFLKFMLVPVQVFRTLCAIIITWSVLNILKMFSIEITVNLLKSKKLAENYMVELKNIISSIRDILLIIDLDNKIIQVNKVACRVLGYTEEEFIGLSIYNLVEKEEIDSIKNRELIKLSKIRPINFELNLIAKDNKRVPVLITFSLIKAIEGKSANVLCVAKDMRELKNLKKKLADSEKLAAMGKVANVLGHEFRNQLAVMKLSTYFLKMKYGDNDEVMYKHLNLVDERILESNIIIENILSFSRTKKLDLKIIDLGGIIMSSIVKVQIHDEIDVITEINKEPLRIEGDEIQLNRLFSNILINSLHAMEGKGQLIITTSVVNCEILVLIKDNGVGIKKEDLNHIFEPFFTTKSNGTGIGLAIAQNIVKLHRGEIQIKSEFGKGTEVLIKFLRKDK
ncbi:MAG: PAS domain-containing protein [Candidatus Omnitrophica bacterium]|nr:PAS domain-containing protein [Candidatus Omnitrophota bacterium]